MNYLVLVDDDLSPEEENILIAGWQEKSMFLSHWPKADNFRKQPFWNREWSAENKRWFSLQMREFQARKTTPLTRKGWQDYLQVRGKEEGEPKDYYRKAESVTATVDAIRGHMNDLFSETFIIC